MTDQRTDWISRLEDLEERLETLHSAGDDGDEENDDGLHEQAGQQLVQILTDTCEVVRDAERNGAEDLDGVIKRAQEVIDFGVSIAYGSEGGFFDFLPSFAHSEATPLVKDVLTMPFAQGMIDVMIPFFRDFLASIPGSNGSMPPIPGPGPWNKDDQPHAKTTRLARFRPGVSVSTTEATPLATNIYQARCDVWSDGICVPITTAVSSGGTCLAVAAAGGWKNRDPVVHYYRLDEEHPLGHPKSVDEVGLSETASELVLDEARKLMFVADGSRIKSFRWDTGDTAKRVHTMGDGRSGPVALLPNGRIARAGKGDAAVWTIDDLETHRGRRLIGPGKFDAEDSWRDNDEGDIELSTGSAAHATVTFAETGFVPGAWHLHAPTGRMLCGEKRGTGEDSGWACLAIDMEHGGQTAARYLGHGGDIDGLATSAGDANVFATAASDGFVRLYDVRTPLPAATLDSGRQSEPCRGVVLVHPDGIPTVFSAGCQSQQIKMWDVRARAVVYELASGNNDVVSLAWDEGRTTLFAATECSYMDRLGYTHDYRRAKIPRWADGDLSDPAPDQGGAHADAADDENGWVDEDEDEDEDLDDDEDSDDDEERCWPKRAFHGENFYGYAYDAGDHMVYSYVFKEDPDRQVPEYGQASMNENYY